MSSDAYNCNSLSRRTLKALKGKMNETPKSSRKSLGSSMATPTPKGKENFIGDKYDSLPRKIFKRVRKSMTLNRQPEFRIRTNEERAMHEEMGLEDRPYHDEPYDPSKPSMRFDCTNRHSFQKEIGRLHGMYGVDHDKMYIGGMINLHQYCYKIFKSTGDPVFRDGANFFRNADPLCFSDNDRMPIRMVHANLISCEKAEPWYRDFFQTRDVNKFDVYIYKEDSYTNYDKLFDQVGRDGPEMMSNQIQKLEDYCAGKLEYTNLDIYKKGVEFWRKTSPMHLPRNYQLALLLGQQRDWPIYLLEDWFHSMYESNCFRGGRTYDVYPISLV